MNTDPKHDCRNDDQTHAHIEKHGLSVIVIEADAYLPGFAYSIGLWKKFGHPEIIAFGLPPETLHAIINDVAALVKQGGKMEAGKDYPDIFANSPARFLQVDPRNMTDYFGYALDYYGTYENTHDFPALQLVWPDRNQRFPWEDGFEEGFTHHQPLLDRNAEFKFRESWKLRTFTTRQWLELAKPILRVVHEEDGDWQFLTGDQLPEDIRIVALGQIVSRDLTLNEVFNLSYGEEAVRDKVGAPWRRSKVEAEAEDE